MTTDDILAERRIRDNILLSCARALLRIMDNKLVKGRIRDKIMV